MTNISKSEGTQENLCEALIKKLNLLVAFIDVANNNVFELIRNHETMEGLGTIGQLYENNYDAYKRHILNSAFLLGYGHFEAYLSEMILLCLRARPELMQPVNGKKEAEQKQISYIEIINSKTYDNLIETIAQREVKNLMYKNISEVIDYFGKKLNMEWRIDIKNELIVASKIRNCLMHNNGVAGIEFQKQSEFVIGELIELNVGKIHSLGLKVREISYFIWENYEQNYQK